MKGTQTDRRRFITNAATTLGATAMLSALPGKIWANAVEESSSAKRQFENAAPRIKFSVIGINHPHIHSQIGTVIRGGGQLVSFYAKEADLAADFVKRYPDAKLARNEREILEDTAIQLVVSAAIPDRRAAIGIAAMRHGKDFMVDKPGVTTLQQLAEVRAVQKETGRIYSILYGRLENSATLKAGELVKGGAIGKVIQTLALAPHRINPKLAPIGSSTSNIMGELSTTSARINLMNTCFLPALPKLQLWLRKREMYITTNTRHSRILAM